MGVTAVEKTFVIWQDPTGARPRSPEGSIWRKKGYEWPDHSIWKILLSYPKRIGHINWVVRFGYEKKLGAIELPEWAFRLATCMFLSDWCFHNSTCLSVSGFYSGFLWQTSRQIRV